MPLLETVVAAVGRLALAAAYDGPVRADARTDERPAMQGAAVYVAAALSWLSERRTLTRRKLDHDARDAVRFKDLLVAGTVITGLAILARQRRSAEDEVEPRYGHVLGAINRAFAVGAVASTPFINFGLFNAYKPHPIRSFFKL